MFGVAGGEKGVYSAKGKSALASAFAYGFRFCFCFGGFGGCVLDLRARGNFLKSTIFLGDDLLDSQDGMVMSDEWGLKRKFCEGESGF